MFPVCIYWSCSWCKQKINKIVTKIIKKGILKEVVNGFMWQQVGKYCHFKKYISVAHVSRKSVVFCWLRNEWSRKRFSHTHLGVWVLVCAGGLGHMMHVVFQFSCCRSLSLTSLPPTRCRLVSFFRSIPVVSPFFLCCKSLVGSYYCSF